MFKVLIVVEETVKDDMSKTTSNMYIEVTIDSTICSEEETAKIDASSVTRFRLTPKCAFRA